MSLATLLGIPAPATSATSCKIQTLQLEPAPLLACTSATSATSENNDGEIKPTEKEKAELARLVERVYRADGWDEVNITEAIKIAIADYQSALVCFTDMAQRKGREALVKANLIP